MNDVDASSKLHRDNYETLIAHVLEKIPVTLEQAISESGLTLDQIDAIELLGGSTRVPAVRARIQLAFPGKTLSTTLNQDEAVARGATFACAMLSPTFRVRDFHMNDITPYSIKVQWAPIPTDPDDDTELVVFPRGNGIPSTKVLTFYRKEPFDIEATYSEPSLLPGGINPWVAKFTAKSVNPSGPSADAACVKLKTRLNLHGVLSFEAAYIEEVEEKEEAMDVDTVPDGELKPAPPKKKRHVKKTDVPFVTGTSSLDTAILERLKEQEAQMHAADKLVMDTEDRKNALEEYVYDTRGKLDDRYAHYVQPQEKEKLLVALHEAEEWLYTEEGEEALKSAYVERLAALKTLGDPIASRYFESENRPKAIAALRDTLNHYLSLATSSEEKYAHIEEKDKQSVVEKCANIQKWLEDQIVRQAERPKDVEPVLTEAEIARKRDEVIYFATPIMSKPKPKPPVLPTPSASTAGTPSGAGTQTPNRDMNTPDPAASKPATEADKGPSQMDVD
jgi:heat shock protein 4